jgi:transposase
MGISAIKQGGGVNAAEVVEPDRTEPYDVSPPGKLLGEVDAGYQGAKTAAAIANSGSGKLEIVQRNEPHRFVVLPKRRIVERTLGWISDNRRLARAFERYARSAAAFVRRVIIRIMLKRLTRSALCFLNLTSWIGSKWIVSVW